MHLGKYYLVILTEMNIKDSVYCQNHLGYDIVCSQLVLTADGGAQGGVDLFMREWPEG